MITWTRHAANYEMQKPDPKFPIAVWLSGTHDEADRLIYSICIYAGGNLIDHAERPDFESAEGYVIEWFEKLKEQLEEILAWRQV